jgi:hypothetical protein
MIERDLLEDIFNQLHASGVDTDRELLWGYFFAHDDFTTLQQVIPILTAQGYRYVDIFEPETEDDAEPEVPVFFLHVEKAETHTIESLEARNAELDAFALEHGLDSYDGMDVGNVDRSGLWGA